MTILQHKEWHVKLSSQIMQYDSLRMFRQIIKNQGYQYLFNTPLSKQNININVNVVQIVSSEQQKKAQSQSTENIKIVIKDLQMSDAAVFALSGQLSIFGQDSKHQFVPYKIRDLVVANSLAIFILQIINSKITLKTKKHQVSVVDLVKYVGAFNITAKQSGLLTNPLGSNYLDGGAPFYRLYQCKQGVIAVGNLEPKFYVQMLKGFDLKQNIKQYLIDSQNDIAEWQKIKQIFTEEFKKRTAKQWETIMSKFDTCVTEVKDPVLNHEKQPKIHPLIIPKL